ncbi:MAG: DNA-directed RNA polymerase subunit omega [Flavobacteriales bacterium AspAUS03]
MNLNSIKAPQSTITIDRKELEKSGESIYAITTILGKRADQINSVLKKELDNKLEEFATSIDSLEEIFENREQIEVSKIFERLPKPTSIAIQEFLDGKIYYRKPDKAE